MDKKYKAISTIVTHKPRTKYDSETREKRYVIIDTESGEIVDDAQGYGYKTALTTLRDMAIRQHRKLTPAGPTRTGINQKIKKKRRKRE